MKFCTFFHIDHVLDERIRWLVDDTETILAMLVTDKIVSAFGVAEALKTHKLNPLRHYPWSRTS